MSSDGSVSFLSNFFKNCEPGSQDCEPGSQNCEPGSQLWTKPPYIHEPDPCEGTTGGQWAGQGCVFWYQKLFAEKFLSQIANDIVFASIFHFSKFFIFQKMISIFSAMQLKFANFDFCIFQISFFFKSKRRLIEICKILILRFCIFQFFQEKKTSRHPSLYSIFPEISDNKFYTSLHIHL